jgi:predicted oxidoreductase
MAIPTKCTIHTRTENKLNIDEYLQTHNYIFGLTDLETHKLNTDFKIKNL